MEIQGRGMVTHRIKEESKRLLGYEINTVELRFMPYFQYVLINNAFLDLRKVSSGEIEILEFWKSKGYIGGDLPLITISEKFWEIICRIIYLGYVDLNREK